MAYEQSLQEWIVAMVADGQEHLLTPQARRIYKELQQSA